MKVLGRSGPTMKPLKLQRGRLSPARRLTVSARRTPPSLPPLPPLKDFTSLNPLAPPVPVPASRNADTLAHLRRKYLEDISMVIHKLKAVLTYGPGSACPNAPVPPSVVLKLVRTVQTLEKLRALLLMNPARLHRVSSVQMETVEQQITRNLLPIATLFRRFDNERQNDTRQDSVNDTSRALKIHDSDGSLYGDAKSPCSPFQVVATPVPRYDWRFLSMALSLQL